LQYFIILSHRFQYPSKVSSEKNVMYLKLRAYLGQKKPETQNYFFNYHKIFLSQYCVQKYIVCISSLETTYFLSPKPSPSFAVRYIQQSRSHMWPWKIGEKVSHPFTSFCSWFTPFFPSSKEILQDFSADTFFYISDILTITEFKRLNVERLLQQLIYSWITLPYQEVRLQIGPLAKLGLVKSTADNFLVYIVTISLAIGPWFTSKVLSWGKREIWIYIIDFK